MFKRALGVYKVKFKLRRPNPICHYLVTYLSSLCRHSSYFLHVLLSEDAFRRWRNALQGSWSPCSWYPVRGCFGPSASLKHSSSRLCYSLVLPCHHTILSVRAHKVSRKSFSYQTHCDSHEAKTVTTTTGLILAPCDRQHNPLTRGSSSSN